MHLVILKAFAVFAGPLDPGSSLALARSLVRDTRSRVPGEWSEAEREPGPSARSAKRHIGHRCRLKCDSPGMPGRSLMKLPHRRQFLRLAAGAAAAPVVSRVVWAQTYPARPVRIIVGL